MLPFLRTKPWYYRFLPKQRYMLSAVIVVTTLLVLFYSYQLLDAYRNTRQIIVLEKDLQKSIFAKDWDGVKAALRGLDANASELEGDLDRLFPFTIFPFLNNEASAARNLLVAAKINIQSASEVIDWLTQFKLLQKKEVASLQSVATSEKIEFLNGLAQSAPLWDQVDAKTKLAINLLQIAKTQSKLPILSGQINYLADFLDRGSNLFNSLRPLLPILPQAIGYPQSKTYLLLLQNNTELRPTGGFIGTFGSLTVKNGEVINFDTENIYNLDEPAKAFNTKVPPLPIQKYLKQAQWFLRDVNWDPDFPTTAQEAIRFYHDERGPIARFDGVIAFTPRLIEDLLLVTGSINIKDSTFSADNIVDKLQYEVEVGFKEDGVNIYNRKQIIDDLAQVLKTKILNFSGDELQSLLPLVKKAFDERQAMVYFTDSKLQSAAADFNWDNRIKENDGDYFYVVDANLGSLKTDPSVDHMISYSLRPVVKDHSLVATLNITYTNKGDFNWKTTRYRTYTRVYVPLGATLITASGNEESIAITDSHNKTVFGTFISTEPGDSETLSFVYKLPTSLANKIFQGNYDLYIQKQAGTEAHNLKLDIALPFSIIGINPIAILKSKENNQVIGTWNLQIDRTIHLQAK